MTRVPVSAQLRRMYHSVTAPFLVMASEDAVWPSWARTCSSRPRSASPTSWRCGQPTHADVTQVVEAMSHDARIGGAFPPSRDRFGGSCFRTSDDDRPRGRSGRTAARPCWPPSTTSTITPVRLRARASSRRRRIAGGPKGALLGLTFKPGYGRPARSAVADHRIGRDRGPAPRWSPTIRWRPHGPRAAGIPGLQIADPRRRPSRAPTCRSVTEWSEFTQLDWRPQTLLRRRHRRRPHALDPSDGCRASGTPASAGAPQPPSRPRSRAGTWSPGHRARGSSCLGRCSLTAAH